MLRSCPPLVRTGQILVKRPLAAILLTGLATAVIGADMIRADETTFDKNKGKLYAAYTRELTSNPGLAARMVFEIRIATDGRVANCRVVSSDAPTPALGDALCQRIREIPFTPRETARTFTKRIDFFPAG
jgi:Na+-translocating ferredoxin:NAD+ oxidoreductase RnfG subunit